MQQNNDSIITPTDCLQRLLDYCIKEDFAGYDPYDALNSRLFHYLPFLDSKYPRLVFTQLLKRCPINTRPVFLIPKTQNPKALGLFLTALIKLIKLGILEQSNLIPKLVEKISELRTPELNYWCWGYSFPWQNRVVLVDRGSPNLVCTVFVGNALLDTYEFNQNDHCLAQATSAADYLMNELYWHERDVHSFSYPHPTYKTPVHNANLLAAAFLCRVQAHTNRNNFTEIALKVAHYSANKQQENGSWFYGEGSTQRWVDNFHTGYNLCALNSLAKYAKTNEFDAGIRKGFEFYHHNFFAKDGIPKYYHDKTYPVDIHCAAQSIITLLELQNLAKDTRQIAEQVWQWTLANLWNNKDYFYYQKQPYYTNKISYMRWSQAWMLLALSTMLESQSKLN